MLNKERVKFKLAQSKTPFGRYFITGYVKVIDFNGGGTAQVKFSREFARFVGESLPHGVGENRMAYLQVIQISLTQWVVVASYVDNSAAAILWEPTEKPVWLNIKRGVDLNGHKQSTGTSDIHPPSSGSSRAKIRDGRIASS